MQESILNFNKRAAVALALILFVSTLIWGLKAYTQTQRVKKYAHPRVKKEEIIQPLFPSPTSLR